MSTKYEQSRRAETNDVCYCRAEGEDMDNNDDDNDIEGMSDNFITLLPLLLFITYREITISGVVPKLKSDNTTPSLTRSFKRRSLFDVDCGCNRCRRARGSKCTRFRVNRTGSW